MSEIFVFLQLLVCAAFIATSNARTMQLVLVSDAVNEVRTYYT